MKKLKVLAAVLAVALTANVHAAVQVRPGVAIKTGTSIGEAFKLIRQMESKDGALGLDATLEYNSTSKAYEETSAINNIDSHMCKNTEWGAIAMLSASNYGAGNGNVKSSYNTTTATYDVSASTTGNMTGVFGMNKRDYEIVAGGIVSKLSSNYLKYAPIRYVDSYPESESVNKQNYIPGDATFETYSFLYNGGFVYNNQPLFQRSGWGGPTNFNGTSETWGYDAVRPCLWVGEGI